MPFSSERTRVLRLMAAKSTLTTKSFLKRRWRPVLPVLRRSSRSLRGSPSSFLVSTTTAKLVTSSHAEIDGLNKHYGERFRILKGIKSDILADGSLDYPEDVLASFDFVVASVHGRFKLSRKEQTDRILQAVANPRTAQVRG